MFDPFNGGYTNGAGNANFLDDSILFSQKSNVDNGDFHIFSAPFTPIQNVTKEFHTGNLTNWLNSNSVLAPEERPSREQITGMIKYTNHTLKNFGYSALGDLTSSKDDEIQKTLNAVYELIQQRIRDIEFRKEIFEKMAKIESDKSMQIQNVDRMKSDNNSLANEIGALKNSIALHEKKCKLEKEKLSSEREELAKQIAKANQKHVQYQHEIRKKEAEVNRVKEQMRKPLFEKNGPSKYYSEVITSDGQTTRVAGFSHKANAENELTTATSTKIDVYRNKLLTENQELRNILQFFQAELTAVCAEKREEFVKKRMSEASNGDTKMLKNYYDNFFADTELIVVKPGIYQMPIDKVGSDLLQIFKENFKIFRKFLSKLLNFSFPPEFFRDISKDFQDIDHNFAKVKSFIDLKKALTGLRKKWTDTSSIKGGTGNTEHFVYTKSEKLDLNDLPTPIDLCSLSELGPDVLGLNQENIPKLSNENQFTTRSSLPSATKMTKADFTSNQADAFTKRNKSENTPPTESPEEAEDRFNELLNFKTENQEKEKEKESQNSHRRVATEINKWKNALHTRSEPKDN
jgi:hypothetical protein